MAQRRKAAIFNLDDSLTYRISRLFSKINTGTARQLGQQFDLRLREWRVLALLAQHEPLSASELVDHSPMDKGSVSRAVARLARLGYIRMLPHRRDGRVQTLRLTAAGWAAYRQIAPLSIERQDFLLSVLTPAQAISLFTMLGKIEAQADRYFAAASPAEAQAGAARRRRTDAKA